MKQTLKTHTEKHPVSMFLLITFAYTWAVWFFAILLPDDWGLRKIVTGMGFGPAVAAIILSMLTGKKCIENSKKWWSWFAISFVVLLCSYLSIIITGDAINASGFTQATPLGLSLMNITLCLLAAIIGAFIVASAFGAQAPVYSGILSFKNTPILLLSCLLLPSVWLLGGIIIAFINNQALPEVMGGLETLTWILYTIRSVLFTLLVVAVGEELGWRGWMLPALQRTFSPLLSTIIVGIFWGIWHLPLYIMGVYDEPPYMVVAKIGVCIFLGVMFTWFYNRSLGNVLTAVLLHTALNSSQRLFPVTEQMGILMILTFVLFIVIDKMWQKKIC